MLRLIMRRGPTPGAIYELTEPTITIGRGSKNAIVIRDNEVSREHCMLVRRGDDYELVDGTSSNGTFVNGMRIAEGGSLLRAGALIELGDSITLEYERVNLPALETVLNGTGMLNGRPEAPSRHYVTVTSGPNIGHVYPLEDIIITVGRETSNDITLADPEVSRYHLRLRREMRGYSIEDMGSTNGTLLNGVPLTQPTLLSHRDQIRLGTMVQIEYLRQTVESETAPFEDDDTPNRPIELAPTASLARHETLVMPHKGGTRTLGTGLEVGALRDHVFLAYDRFDWQKVAAPLLMAMQDAGMKVWVDQYLAYDSDPWRAAVDQAKRECELMVLVVSPHSMINTVLKQTYRDFRSMGKPIVPLLYDSTIPATGSLNTAKPIVYDVRDPMGAARQIASVIADSR